jgi:YaiO family outer membrane protein
MSVLGAAISRLAAVAIVVAGGIAPATADQRSGGLAPAERFAEARALGQQGDYDRALEKYDALRRDYPHDVDFALGRAQVLMWLERDPEALAELEIAASLAPEYETVWRLWLAVLSRQPGADAARDLERLRDHAAARFPASSWWHAPPVIVVRRWTLSAGLGLDTLDNGQPNWNNQFLSAGFARSADTTYLFRMARNVRFDAADGQYGVGAEWRLGDAWFAGGDAGFSPNARFLPDVDIGAHVGRTLKAGWVADIRYRHRSYPTATVNTVISMAEKYVGNYRVAYSLGVSHLRGAGNTLSHSLIVNWYSSEQHSFGVSIATGEEAEAIGPDQVLEMEVRGLTLLGRHRINDRIGLSWSAGLHDQGEFYRRHFVGLAVSIRI